jgi:hypothetical protein
VSERRTELREPHLSLARFDTDVDYLNCKAIEDMVLLLCGKCGRSLGQLTPVVCFHCREEYMAAGLNRPTGRRVISHGYGEPLEQTHDVVIECHRNCGTRHRPKQMALKIAYETAKTEGRYYVMCGDGKAAMARGGRDA